jgi:hypothetical protein
VMQRMLGQASLVAAYPMLIITSDVTDNIMKLSQLMAAISSSVTIVINDRLGDQSTDSVSVCAKN